MGNGSSIADRLRVAACLNIVLGKVLTHIENCRAAITNCTREGAALLVKGDRTIRRRYQRCPGIYHGKLCSLITTHSDLVQQGHALVTYDHWDSRRDGNTLWNRKAVRLILIRHQCLLKACQRVGHFPCRDREGDVNIPITGAVLNCQFSGPIKRYIAILYYIQVFCCRINFYRILFFVCIGNKSVFIGFTFRGIVRLEFPS